MKAKRTTTAEQLNYITQCKHSGLGVYRWCDLNGITPTSYYNWISRLRSKGLLSPEVLENCNTLVSNTNEVVKMEILPENTTMETTQLSTTSTSRSNISNPTAEISIGNAVIRFFTETNTTTIEATLKNLGGCIYGG